MRLSRISFIVLLVVLFLAAWWFWKSKRLPPAEAPLKTAPASPANTVAPSGTTSQPNVPADKAALASQIAALEKDHKVVAIEAVVAKMDAASQDFYGKIIDQYGHPVAGATATGTLMQMEGVDTGTKKDFYTTQSDNNGYFEFTNLHGWQLGVVVKKDGYEMGQGAGFYEAPNAQDKTSSEQRAVFHMWKLQGAEPMVHTSIQAGLACNGTPRNFDVLTGRRDAGDLVATLTRNPVNIDQGKPFDWTLTLGIADGGLIEINDLYPNEAPGVGYQPSVAINMPADAKNWAPSMVKSFYIYDGKNYGRITINIMADYQPPPTHFEIDSYVNPSPADRNLEFDPTQAIKP